MRIRSSAWRVYSAIPKVIKLHVRDSQRYRRYAGATTMDTTLPIITRCSGQEYVILSLFHGFLVDFSVPFLVSLFCSL